MQLYNVELDNLKGTDYPDFADTFILYAENEHGKPLTEKQLNSIPDNIVYEYILQEYFG